MMENEGKMFDQQVHDAFERIELSDEAQERMLGALMTAQERRQAEQSGEAATYDDEEAAADETRVVSSPFEEQAEVIQVARRRFGWHAALPLAAVLVLAVIVVGVQNIGAPKGTMSESSAPVSEEAVEVKDTTATSAGDATTESTALEAEDANAAQNNVVDSAEEASGADAVYAESMGMVDYYPCVTLEDGTKLTALRDGLHTEELAASQVGDLLGTARASAFDDTSGTNTVACEVFALKDARDAYAVRYEGEQTYWRAAKMG